MIWSVSARPKFTVTCIALFLVKQMQIVSMFSLFFLHNINVD